MLILGGGDLSLQVDLQQFTCLLIAVSIKMRNTRKSLNLQFTTCQSSASLAQFQPSYTFHIRALLYFCSF
jgi:hypothetical protein